jgi:ribosomal protein S18 acetylase RimI-like enzyme
VIRAIELADVDRLAHALATLPLMIRYRRGEEALATDLRAAIDRGDDVLVHDLGGGADGLAWFTTSGTFGALGGYLRLIAVAPGCEGKGVGVALLAAFETAVTARSRHAFLLVSDFNDAAQRFYARHGYSRIGTVPAAVLPGVDELIYWKRLR